jgi:hypothetical protein
MHVSLAITRVKYALALLEATALQFNFMMEIIQEIRAISGEKKPTGGRGAVVARERQKAPLQPGQGTTNLQHSTAPVRVAFFIMTSNMRPGHPTKLVISQSISARIIHSRTAGDVQLIFEVFEKG